MIKISVIITTLNEAKNLPRCLQALERFDDVIIVDSGSEDTTTDIAKQYGARVEGFQWNGQYPKKRQWCLDHIQTKYNYIFFLDADEQVTAAMVEEMKNLSFDKVGYFVMGDYCWRGTVLSHGLKNNKLALFHKDKFEFPIINDLDDFCGSDFCMGEMEGHYQPVLKAEHKNEHIGKLHFSLVHFAYEDAEAWRKRHLKYAKWEAGMIANNLYHTENNKTRETMKRFFRKTPMRGLIAFLHGYVLKKGFLDGRAGFYFAQSRYHYYQMVAQAMVKAKAKDKAF